MLFAMIAASCKHVCRRVPFSLHSLAVEIELNLEDAIFGLLNWWIDFAFVWYLNRSANEKYLRPTNSANLEIHWKEENYIIFADVETGPYADFEHFHMKAFLQEHAAGAQKTKISD